MIPKLPANVAQLIEKEAAFFANVQIGDKAKFVSISEFEMWDDAKDYYKAGATAQAIKAQKLVEALEETLKMIQPYTPHQIREIKMKIKTALKQYNSNIISYEV